ncbi:helix-turn-helix transcriptional regulator [Halovivax cerinus]|uniref:Uncharacterized protein n=1 Tax=Halovivax cerinus TaxID=1487865 RepID=A0ABD5NKN3_9EURY|nr:hypothetical protein [Halovivax cerinus]
MAAWPARVVCCGVLFVALVVGALSVGSVAVVDAESDRPIGALATDGVTGDRFGSRLVVADRDRASPRPMGETVRQAQANESPPENETAVPYLAGFDRVTTRIDVAENGSATVTVTYRYLRSDNESDDEWVEVRDDVEANPERYLDGERDRWNDTVAAGRNATGREMATSEFAIRTGEGMTPQPYGDVIVTFRWSSFAEVEPKWIGDAGDALVQFALEDDATLRISWPEGYSLQAVAPEPDESERETVVGWHGDETDFLEDEPRVTAYPDGPPPRASDPPEPTRSVLPLLVAGVGIVVLATGVLWWARRDDEEPRAPMTDADDAPTVAPPPDLMSNEERVLTLLDANGGRMKQQTVISELDWTEAKTSQVVGDLREDGDIEVFRLGRENVLALPDRTAATSDGRVVAGDTDESGSGDEDASAS